MVRAANERSRSFYVGCVIWCSCCFWLIKNDLGPIAFVGTVFLSIYAFGLREKFDSEETSSAYSVFNKGGKAIAGGFTGDQLERQLRGGIAHEINSMDKPYRASGDSDSPLVTTSDKSTSKKTLSEKDKLKRRSAAAEAAERRFREQKQHMS